MNKPHGLSPKEVVNLCGGYTGAIRTMMEIVRALWEMTLTDDQSPEKQGRKYKIVDKTRLLSRLSAPTRELTLKLLPTLLEKDIWREKDSQWRFSLSLFHPFSLARNLLTEVRPEHELRYFVWRSIREHYHCPLSSETAHWFHFLGNAVNLIHERLKPAKAPTFEARASRPIWHYTQDFLPYLQDVLKEDARLIGDPQQVIRLFVECCREVGYLWASYHSGYITLRTKAIDAEYLLSHLFGITTGIRGFDELFGGGGLMLADNPKGLPSQQSGRTLLITGRFGTGKTLLSLQLAIEVARKGGIAWVMPFEQSAEECLYTLESMRALPEDQSVVIADDLASATEALRKKAGERGALIILKTIRESYNDFLVAFAADAKQMDQYTLRLISVDPINSIHREDDSTTRVRAQTLAKLEEIKQSGTNILLVAEEGGDSEKDFLSEQNIADTVIRLSLNNRYDYSYRDFEIKKSRLQREQRGAHPFSIVPGAGIRIFPSPAAVRAKVYPRSIRPPDTSTKFGLPSLDDVLGEDAIKKGDVIALQGAGGSFKTPLGLFFLLGTDPRDQRREADDEEIDQDNHLPRRSLLVAARDSKATIDYLLEQPFIAQHVSTRKKSKKKNDIRICSLPSGYVNPGYIFQRIEDEVLKARRDGCWIDRIMIDDVAHWEMGCPAIRDDETFGDTLIDFLRRHHVTSLLTCGEISQDTHSVVQRSIIESADCAIRFEQFEFRGVSRVVIRILKSRGMRHRRESFEITLGPRSLEVKPSSSLLRVLHSGEVEPVKIRLFLHSETEMQKEYNDNFLAATKAVLSRDIQPGEQDLIYRNGAIELGPSSAVDELQVLQIDEFQLPHLSSINESSSSLYSFSAAQWEENKRHDKEPERQSSASQSTGSAPGKRKKRHEEEGEWHDFVPRLRDRCRAVNGSFFAVPFYENVSLLAYRRDEFDKYHLAETLSWESLVDAYAEWEKHPHEDPTAVFFDFPQATKENYNCLFFEILLSYKKQAASPGLCGLRTWLRSDDTIKASKIYRRLCRRAYHASPRALRSADTNLNPITVNPNAVVWRHWYTTLNQMLYGLPSKIREKIEVRPLPGDIAIAGEWYLGVPAYSAAPDVGLNLIKLLTTHEAELDRLRAGIGLPTRQTFYQPTIKDTMDAGISPYFSMNVEELNKLVEGAFRRSGFECYSQFSNILAHYLQRIIEIPDKPGTEIEERIQDIFKGMDARMEFLRSDRDCTRCRFGSSGPAAVQ